MKLKSKKIILALLLTLIIMPTTTLAKETDDNFKVISVSEKYYKTISSSNNLSLTNTRVESIEISKEEYDNVSDNIQTRGTGGTETTYKKLTTTILSNGSLYRYKTVLNWKQFPAVRSYDNIGIGHYASVTYNSSLNFSQSYCLTNGTCKTLTTYYPQYFSTGVGATFKVPEGDLTSLSQTLFYDVRKNTTATVLSQAAYGDYSHATDSVSLSQAQSFSVGTSGIQFTNGVGNYYDDIQPATATWSGSW